MDNPRIINFGCRLNIAEGAAISEHVKTRDDIIVVNTCAVTGEAERQARQKLRRLNREHPDKKIYVTGCAAQLHPRDYAALPGVERVIGNEHKADPASYITSTDHKTIDDKIHVTDIMRLTETAAHMAESFEGRTRAFLEIQNGCNHRCTFCIIPFARGNNRSVPGGDIVRRAKELTDKGYAELVLTGVDITDYGKDLPGAPTLSSLIKRILDGAPNLQRLRLSSIDVSEIDEMMYRLIEEEARLMPHFHLSLQAGDNMILKRMKRRHTREDALRFCERARELRRPMAFGADFIAGFPTETEDMFNNTLNLIHEAKLQFLHVFPYAPRPGTPAARMPQIPKSLRKERAARLRAAGEQELAVYRADREAQGWGPLLHEKDGNAKTEDFLSVRTAS